MSAPHRTVPVVEHVAPVLLGDRLKALRRDLSGGVVTLGLVLGLGVVFLVAGLRPTSVTFGDGGSSYEAACGIETAVVGSTWDALDAACGEGSGLRLLAAGGGAVLLLGGLGQLAWLLVRRSSGRAAAPGPVRSLLDPPRARAAVVGIAAAAVVAVGATFVARARLDAAALTGACSAGGDCPDRSGLAGAVRLGAVLASMSFAAVLVWPILRRRPVAFRAGVGLLVAAALLLLLAVRPVSVAGDELRGTCGVEVLLAGHPQPSVTAACRGAMSARPAVGAAALVSAVAGALLLRAGRKPGPEDRVIAEAEVVPTGPSRRPARTRPLVAGEVER